MKRACIIAALSLTVQLAAAAQSTVMTPASSAPMSSHKLQNAIKSAQYKQLATYYRQQEAIYRERATKEKIVEDRRGKVNAASYQKYPRPVDSSRYRYEMFSADADQAAFQAAHWDQLAAGTP